MGVAGLMIEPHPPNFQNLYIFQDVQLMKYFFGYLHWFYIFKDQGLSVLSIPVACPWPDERVQGQHVFNIIVNLINSQILTPYQL